MAHMDTQLLALDEIVSRVRAQNNTHHTAHVSSLSDLTSTVQTSYSNIGDNFTTSFSRIQALGTDMDARAAILRDTLPDLGVSSEIRQPLQALRDDISSQALQEYVPTGETPQRVQYGFPMSLPRTESHEILISKLRNRSPSKSSDAAKAEANRSPSKGRVFTDTDNDEETTLVPSTGRSRPVSATGNGTAMSGLRELDVNIVGAAPESLLLATAVVTSDSTSMPPLKRQNTNPGSVLERGASESRLPTKKGARMTVAGMGAAQDRENIVNLSASMGPGSGMSRRLRSQGST